MWVQTNDNKSFNFIAPEGSADNQEVLFPSVEKQTPDAAAELALTIKHKITIVEVGAMGADMEVDLTIDDQVDVGSMLVMKLESDATGRDVTFGTGILAPVLSGTASKTNYATFIYDGAQFVPFGTPVQVN